MLTGPDDLIDRAARALAIAGLALLLVFAALTLADGLMRGLAKAPIDAVRDLGGLAIAVAVATCFPLAFLRQSNITIAFIDSIVGRRAALWCDAFAAVVTTAVMAAFAWQFFIYAGTLARYGEVTAMLRVSKAPFWYAADAIFWLTVMVQLLVTVRAISLARVAAPAPNAPSS
jgi:TRAP-type C4-dicarboxylate transport system permease small subunit